MTSAYAIRAADFGDARVRGLVRLHLEGMHASSPPGSVYALDLTGLTAPGVTVWTAWSGESVAGMAGLKDLGAGHGEVKSMRTHPDFLRRGVAAALLEHLISQARARGMRRLSLETGSGAPFAAALALYERRGFRYGEPFGDYVPTEFNQFLHLDL
ncbi:MAG: GNAT family N-acetyltransferase [Steroidobacteraceae bacterium]